MTAKVLMVQGASSSVGKSLMVTALCRLYARRGWRVAPFKAQNMSNNAAVCAGGEIGRAQAIQAEAAGIEPTVDMNPILLKPEAEQRSQIIVQGQVWRTLPGRTYFRHKHELWPVVTSSLDRLRAQVDLVVIEGAGSAAELNLKRGDIVNMAVARYAVSPVALVGDIDRGGVFAQLLGTLWLLEPEERALVKGLIVNKFRGDPALFVDGISILSERSGLPVLGVVPYLPDHGIAEEDAVVLDDAVRASQAMPRQIDIAVIRLPHISNFDDFDPLALEPGVRVRYVDRPEKLGAPHAIILPGSKSTISDLDWLHAQGLSAAIEAHARRSVAIVGICGGYQMLGHAVHDPAGVESHYAEQKGLDLFPVTTTFTPQKVLHRSRARIINGAGFLARIVGEEVEGYEIHMGQTSSAAPIHTIIARDGQPVDHTAYTVADGMISDDGRIFGTYLHGLFANDNFRHAWLDSLGAPGSQICFNQTRAAAFDRLADGLEAALDVEYLDQLIGLATKSV